MIIAIKLCFTITVISLVIAVASAQVSNVGGRHPIMDQAGKICVVSATILAASLIIGLILIIWSL